MIAVRGIEIHQEICCPRDKRTGPEIGDARNRTESLFIQSMRTRELTAFTDCVDNRRHPCSTHFPCDIRVKKTNLHTREQIFYHRRTKLGWVHFVNKGFPSPVHYHFI